MEAVSFDQTKADAFADQLLSMLNSGALSVMTSIGHRSGLFDVMQKLPLSTSQEIADAAGLNERYVREWLGAMVTGGFIDYDPGAKAYSLPPEHAAFLCRQASPDNIAVYAQYIAMMGSMEEKILTCFKNGGGVPYTEFERFHEVMAEDSSQTVVSALLEHILPLVPGLPGKLERGIEVLDVGCGAGRAINLMARTYPHSSFRGCDFSEEAIGLARDEAQSNNTPNAVFEVRDVTNLGETGRYDLVTAFDAIHDQVAPDKVLASIADALKPDGVFLMQDIAASSFVEKNLEHPIAPLLYALSTMHCMTVSLSGGGAGLGTMWGEELATSMLKEAGFGQVDINRLPHDFQNSFYVIHK
jgi:SAM-dependent methyltransferase